MHKGHRNARKKILERIKNDEIEPTYEKSARGYFKSYSEVEDFKRY